jgi:hypothetical protein
MDKSNKDLIELIQYVEGKLIELNPIYIEFLPIVRVFIVYSCRAVFTQKRAKKGIVSFVLVLVDTIKSLFSLIRMFIRRSNKPYLIVAPALHRNTQKNNTWISKHLDSLVCSYGQENCFVLEFGRSRLNPSPYSNLSNAVRLIGKTFCWLKPKDEFLDVLAANVAKLVKEHERKMLVNEKRLATELKLNRIASDIYSLVFRRVQYKKCIFVAYYDFEIMAMISVLNSKGIETSDYQHGIQNDNQPLYTHWEHLPKYPNCLPRNFLLWDDVAERRIRRWADKFDVTYTVVGNLWMKTFGISKKNNFSGHDKESKVILVALQLWPDYFNQNVFEVINKTPHVTWVFRQHPIAILPEDEIEKLMGDYPNIRFDTGLDRPLEDAILECEICLTGFSTVGVEALYFGKKTIFTHVNALEGLGDYIDGENCLFASESRDLERAVISELGIQ